MVSLPTCLLKWSVPPQYDLPRALNYSSIEIAWCMLPQGDRVQRSGKAVQSLRSGG